MEWETQFGDESKRIKKKQSIGKKLFQKSERGISTNSEYDVCGFDIIIEVDTGRR